MWGTRQPCMIVPGCQWMLMSFDYLLTDLHMPTAPNLCSDLPLFTCLFLQLKFKSQVIFLFFCYLSLEVQTLFKPEPNLPNKVLQVQFKVLPTLSLPSGSGLQFRGIPQRTGLNQTSASLMSSHYCYTFCNCSHLFPMCMPTLTCLHGKRYFCCNLFPACITSHPSVFVHSVPCTFSVRNNRGPLNDDIIHENQAKDQRRGEKTHQDTTLHLIP